MHVFKADEPALMSWTEAPEGSRNAPNHTQCNWVLDVLKLLFFSHKRAQEESDSNTVVETTSSYRRYKRTSR
jgi:hypothetical protein